LNIERVILQPRDLELIQRLANDFLLLTRRQVAELLPGRSVRRTNFRLRKLHRAGYISRRYPSGMLMARVPLYYLGPGAAEALGLGGQDIKIRQRRRQAIQLKESALPHFLLVDSVHIKFLIASRNCPEFVLLNWVPQYAPIWATLNQYGLPIRPDAYAECRVDALVLRFFVELDRGTERGASIRKKIDSYTQYARSGKFAQHFSAPDFRVLFIAPSQRRAQRLLRIMAGTNHELGAATSFEAFFERPLLEPHWLIPGSETPQSLTTLL
jgi:hypothetical protein